MESVELIITALAAGAAGGTENVVSKAIKDAYQELKQLVIARFDGRTTAEVALAEHETHPGVWRARLEKALGETGCGTDPEVIFAAERLMALLGEPGSTGGRCRVNGHHSRRTQFGPKGVQVNLFPPLGPTRPHSETHEAANGTAGPGQGPPRAFPAVPQEGRAIAGAAQAQQEQVSGPRFISPNKSGPQLVILIERCSGVQVGRDNDQFSAYLVTLPKAAFESGQALADLLLSPDAPWSRDVFSHNARPDLRSAAGGRSASGGIIEGLSLDPPI